MLSNNVKELKIKVNYTYDRFAWASVIETDLGANENQTKGRTMFHHGNSVPKSSRICIFKENDCVSNSN